MMTQVPMEPLSMDDAYDYLDWIQAGDDGDDNLAQDEPVAKYDTSSLQTDPGAHDNWIENKGGTLPMFVRAIAHALIRNGHPRSEAIGIAIGTIKRWAAGGGNVSAKTRAKAAAAVAEWEALKAKKG